MCRLLRTIASLITKLVPNQESMVGTIAAQGESVGYFSRWWNGRRCCSGGPFDLPPAKNGHKAGLERSG